ncbi:hypothetical protein THRCLA_10525 [Thraustotheca clavata]|uniref:Carbonyl reductase n=1 Tax=Thraustotheca clavata TaxID=74557 RepID=A0A1V9YLL6_9STRA|nr:hypothetical protein THRCLA_10525 [Thraustotheca clavata]
MTRLTVLITGATRGLGYEAVRLLSERAHDTIVLLGCRSLDAGHRSIEKMKVENKDFSYDNVQAQVIDVTNSTSIASAVDNIKSNYGHLDVLINNAGIIGRPEEGGVDTCFKTNVFGVYNSMVSFLPIMVPNKAKFIVVASEVGAWSCNAMTDELKTIFLNYENMTQERLKELVEDSTKSYQKQPTKYTWPTFEATYGPYGVSKTMILSITRKFAAEHSPDYHTVMVCPGYCATGLNHFSGFRTAIQGAESILYPLFNRTENGGFYQDGIVHSFDTPRPAHLH